MNAQSEVPFVDTTIIPDRNAGIGSLLWDLQYAKNPDTETPTLLETEFAFVDVGVSRAGVSTTLKTLLTRELRMNVDYVATELPEAVPYAYVSTLGDRAKKIHSYLSGMITTRETSREVTDWHFVVNTEGKVFSVAYSYNQMGNEVWESYYMGHSFMMSGEKVEFADPELDELLAPDVLIIGNKIDLEKKRDSDPAQPAPSWEGYRIEKNPLESGLDESGITLQKTDIPQRIKERQNVLFLGNVLNLYPQDRRDFELNRISANMIEGDIIIVQTDENETSFIEVLLVKGQGALKIRERVRWIDTIKLEIRKPVIGTGSWQQIQLKPVLGKIINYLIDCLKRKVISPEWSHEHQKTLVRKNITQVFATFFRALPVEETLRIAIREALRRLPPEGGLKGIPVFRGDEEDAFGGALGSDQRPIVLEADLNIMKMASANVTG